MTDGAFLSAESGAHIDKPVFLLHLASDSAEDCNLVFDPPWNPDTLSEEVKLELGVL